MNRWVLRATLAVTVFIVLLLIIAALFLEIDPEALAVVTGSLAVIASAGSVWTSQRVVELQEDKLLPYPYPYVDVSSRYQLLQLRTQNFGGTAARNIRLEWHRPLRDRQGKDVGSDELPVLLPQQSVAQVIDVDFAFFQREQDANYSGVVKFQDAHGIVHQHPFYVSIEQYRGSSSHDDELQKTYFKVQQIPEQLKRLNRQIGKLQSTINGH